MDWLKYLGKRRFYFGRVDGKIIGQVTLEPNGTIGSHQNKSEHS
jgi:hypothetical protein